MRGVDWFPLYLSLKVAALATLAALAVGVPLAWLLARRRLPGADLLAALVTLPMVLPPTVLGYYLLLVIGRQSPLGRLLEGRWGITLVFTWQAAVLAATVVAVPLVARSAQAAFEAIDPRLEAAARTLGRSEASVFLTVTMPLAWRGIVAGAVLAFARAMGEFGATLMVAGNIPGQTQTLSVAIYDAVQAGNQPLAAALVVVISVVTVAILAVVGRFARLTGW
ncbi:molybdate ABC transporter permease subunit [Caldinitratiruptor microaerophilus]|uniref:Molybdenum transport system permease n=1 Tax=Caldinitratiruptor microaerophilus TaxID=671077 RepID=A0AA35CIZ2_9FIRM|nr:molybdate ABC transporter permease subunit [Caldinitratiruptor microaerophilus]BDG60032.1 molybdenum ABC transporter permease subunit [Caldinitratiruptor microaerophilus]